MNSGRATKERTIESTALKTNLEAAEEVARQCRLRDLAGLLVIDFIDMEENRNNRAVEKRLKESLKHDRARVQVGRISNFGLLEMSRQRMRSSVLEGNSAICEACHGTGVVRSTESTALRILRAIEEQVIDGSCKSVTAKVSTGTALYLLNNKREQLIDIEQRCKVSVNVDTEAHFAAPQFEIIRGPARSPHEAKPETATKDDTQADAGAAELDRDAAETDKADAKPKKRRRRRSRKSSKNGKRADTKPSETDESEDTTAVSAKDESAESEQAEPKRKRRRGRRGGKRQNKQRNGEQNAASNNEDAATVSESAPDTQTDDEAAKTKDDRPKKPKRRAKSESTPPSTDAPEDKDNGAAKPREKAPSESSSVMTESETPMRIAPEPEAPAPSSEPTPDVPIAAQAEKESKPARRGWWQRRGS